MGGQSGSVTWPAYMQAFHGQILNEGGTVVVDGSIARQINTVLHATSNPFTGKTAYDPTTDLTLLDARVTAWINYINGLDAPGSFTQFNLAFDNATTKLVAFDNTVINADVAAFTAEQTDILTNQTLPRFNAGFLNINAVNTSAFTIGQALLNAFMNRDIAKHASDLRLKVTIQRQELIRFFVVQMMTDFLEVARIEGTIASVQTDVAKLKTSVKTVQQEQQISIDESNIKWYLDVFNYGFSALGAISGGGQGHIRNPRASAAVAALSGALSGAAAGSAVYAGYGTAIGAVVGAGIALATR